MGISSRCWSYYIHDLWWFKICLWVYRVYRYSMLNPTITCPQLGFLGWCVAFARDCPGVFLGVSSSSWATPTWIVYFRENPSTNRWWKGVPLFHLYFRIFQETTSFTSFKPWVLSSVTIVNQFSSALMTLPVNKDGNQKGQQRKIIYVANSDYHRVYIPILALKSQWRVVSISHFLASIIFNPEKYGEHPNQNPFETPFPLLVSSPRTMLKIRASR